MYKSLQFVGLRCARSFICLTRNRDERGAHAKGQKKIRAALRAARIKSRKFFALIGSHLVRCSSCEQLQQKLRILLFRRRSN